jgi:hypothetical protein
LLRHRATCDGKSQSERRKRRSPTSRSGVGALPNHERPLTLNLALSSRRWSSFFCGLDSDCKLRSI